MLKVSGLIGRLVGVVGPRFKVFRFQGCKGKSIVSCSLFCVTAKISRFARI